MNKTTKILIGILLAAIVVAIVLFLTLREKEEIPQNGLPEFPRAQSLLEGRAAILPSNMLEQEAQFLEQFESAQQPIVSTPEGAEPGQLQQIALKKLSPETTAGAIIVASTSPIVRYVRLDNGHVWDVFLNSSKEPLRVSNVTIPFIYRVRWGSDSSAGERAILEFNDQEQTKIYSAVFGNKPSGSFLNSAITTYAFSPDSSKIISGLPTVNGLQIVRTDTVGGSPATLTTMLHNDFVVDWPATSLLGIVEKASAHAPGSFFTYNITNRTLAKILDRISGLTILWSPDANQFLYSSSNNSSIQLFATTPANPQQAVLLAKTLPEKCVWSKKDANYVYCGVPRNIPTTDYPDAWWQGRISFTDDLFKFNTKTGEAIRLVNTISDIVDISVAEKDDFILFRDKKDGTPWTVTLSE